MKPAKRVSYADGNRNRASRYLATTSMKNARQTQSKWMEHRIQRNSAPPEFRGYANIPYLSHSIFFPIHHGRVDSSWSRQVGFFFLQCLFSFIYLSIPPQSIYRSAQAYVQIFADFTPVILQVHMCISDTHGRGSDSWKATCRKKFSSKLPWCPFFHFLLPSVLLSDCT